MADKERMEKTTNKVKKKLKKKKIEKNLEDDGVHRNPFKSKLPRLVYEFYLKLVCCI